MGLTLLFALPRLSPGGANKNSRLHTVATVEFAANSRLQLRFAETDLAHFTPRAFSMQSLAQQPLGYGDGHHESPLGLS